MKVVFKKSIVEQIADIKAAAEEKMQEIERIELTVAEAKALRRELDSTFRYTGYGPNSLTDAGRLVTKGDFAVIFGVRVEASESEKRHCPSCGVVEGGPHRSYCNYARPHKTTVTVS